ncbi:uncharacterized protein [Amphiura filiformis]|uniref:uncharacterized protein n=1 Tax=Amphiura filiformis TaxID=82378 RepID=UPI003B213F6B
MKLSRFSVSSGYTLQGYDFKTLYATSVTHCSLSCISYRQCPFNYIYDTGNCELNTIPTECQSAYLTIANRTSFFGKLTLHPPEEGPIDCNTLSDQFSQHFRRHQESVLKSNDINVLDNINSIISCASHCINYAQCRGFSFSASQHQCEIKDTLSDCSLPDLQSPVSDEVYYHHIDEPCTRSELLLQGLPTSQSTNYHHINGHAHEATDGDKRTFYGSYTCTHTENYNGQWWMIDMQKTKCIRKVIIYNRSDCCRNRLYGAVIRVGMNSDRSNVECGPGVDMTQINSGPMIEIPCDTCGRYLSVHLPGIVTICELQAYVDVCPTHTALPSCAAIRNACYSGGSGTYEIDPDGPNNGVEPFTVLCDMNSGEKYNLLLLNIKP